MKNQLPIIFCLIGIIIFLIIINIYCLKKLNKIEGQFESNRKEFLKYTDEQYLKINEISEKIRVQTDYEKIFKSGNKIKIEDFPIGVLRQTKPMAELLNDKPSDFAPKESVYIDPGKRIKFDTRYYEYLGKIKRPLTFDDMVALGENSFTYCFIFYTSDKKIVLQSQDKIYFRNFPSDIQNLILTPTQEKRCIELGFLKPIKDIK